ncbi:autoinducer binding domain-containing protein [Palleronia abyssalis]|uniref:HTH-type quorum sensing-dependent transcriptional regulator RpaR n=1 Tax=Palleronia abyssalis TaxID=1501240 RepID=A0A2R8BXW3_9RHOB|nr:autoinducer binding domain-containing protein [Palleronia abyssalis]SPJ24916.1 HTH-type quorum sensing-dependent transcriptional regulator RpaR [Palleronia abyssalis]
MGLIDIGAEPTSRDTFNAFIEQLRDRLGVDHAAYAGMDHAGSDIRGFVTYPGAWIEHYQQNEMASKDPTLRLASRSIAPLDWARAAAICEGDRVMLEASDFGLPRNGVTVPVRGPFGDIGMLSVSAHGSPEQWKKQFAHIRSDLQSMAVYLHDRVVQSFTDQNPAMRPLMSQREIEILQWIAVGKTQRDVGTILSISDRTVEVHLRSARTKLSALTTTQAVARAIESRLINPR